MEKPREASELVTIYIKWVVIIAIAWPLIMLIPAIASDSEGLILFPFKYWWLSLSIIALIVWNKNILYFFESKSSNTAINISTFLDSTNSILNISSNQLSEEIANYTEKEFIKFRNKLIKAEVEAKLTFNPDKWFIKNFVVNNKLEKKVLNMYLDYSLDRLPHYLESAGECNKDLIINRINKSSEINESQLAKEIKSKGKWALLVNFVKQNITNESEISNESERRKLSNLLKKYDIFANDMELYIVLVSVYGEIEYKKFKQKVNLKNPKEILEYIDLFLDIYGENYEDHLGYLNHILYENNLLNQIGLIKPIIEKRKEELEIEQYEQKLTEGNVSKEIDFLSMSGHQFEFFLGDLFKKMGYKVMNTKLSGDQGADLIIEKFNEKIAVQAKNYTKPVSNTAVQEAVASKNHYGCHKAMVVTTDGYTKGAKSLAKSNNVELWDKEKLLKEIKKYF